MNTPVNSSNYQDNNNQQSLSQQCRVFADFNNADEEGRLRLNCIGTIEDLARQKIELQDAQTLTFYSEDLEVEGIVKHSQEDNIWVAVIDWDNIKQVEDDLEVVEYTTTQTTLISDHVKKKVFVSPSNIQVHIEEIKDSRSTSRNIRRKRRRETKFLNSHQHNIRTFEAAKRTLIQLKKLFEQGLITEEEYKIKRQSLVDKL
ncbi:SHOCT domain-containing protein [Sphaerospermopsis aphanizomenoides]|uniref:SHOCT domain-containing protein n=1 Tax=Sphaerospermopsis aphanizomenoides TaxID=459663 RepID=UPI001F41299E|nr:SHOCT domain-containing protein [Sphaerospermopsis aphanizomenoides]